MGTEIKNTNWNRHGNTKIKPKWAYTMEQKWITQWNINAIQTCNTQLNRN
jgi:hypothetical protein